MLTRLPLPVLVAHGDESTMRGRSACHLAPPMPPPRSVGCLATLATRAARWYNEAPPRGIVASTRPHTGGGTARPGGLAHAPAAPPFGRPAAHHALPLPHPSRVAQAVERGTR